MPSFRDRAQEPLFLIGTGLAREGFGGNAVHPETHRSRAALTSELLRNHRKGQQPLRMSAEVLGHVNSHEACRRQGFEAALGPVPLVIDLATFRARTVVPTSAAMRRKPSMDVEGAPARFMSI